MAVDNGEILTRLWDEMKVIVEKIDNDRLYQVLIDKFVEYGSIMRESGQRDSMNAYKADSILLVDDTKGNPFYLKMKNIIRTSTIIPDQTATDYLRVLYDFGKECYKAGVSDSLHVATSLSRDCGLKISLTMPPKEPLKLRSELEFIKNFFISV